jgi:Ras family protein A
LVDPYCHPSVFSQTHHPHVLENKTVNVAVDGDMVELSMWDIVYDDEHKRLRPISYPGTHIIIITFAIDDPVSLRNVLEKV